MAYHITIICAFLQIPENVTLHDTFSYMHSMLSIEFIDNITSKIKHIKSYPSHYLKQKITLGSWVQFSKFYVNKFIRRIFIGFHKISCCDRIIDNKKVLDVQMGHDTQATRRSWMCRWVTTHKLQTTHGRVISRRSICTCAGIEFVAHKLSLISP